MSLSYIIASAPSASGVRERGELRAVDAQIGQASLR